MNRVELLGNLTRDVELKRTSSETPKPYILATLAVTRDFGSGADFINFKVWGDLAVDCSKTLKKGSRVKLIGYISSSRAGQGDAVKFYEMVVATEIKLLPKASGGAGGASKVEVMPDYDEYVPSVG